MSPNRGGLCTCSKTQSTSQHLLSHSLTHSQYFGLHERYYEGLRLMEKFPQIILESQPLPKCDYPFRTCIINMVQIIGGR